MADPVRIVCAYPDGALPSGWFQAVQRARRTVRRAGYRARVELTPASCVTVEADVVIAPPVAAPAIRASAAAGRAERIAAEFIVVESTEFGAAFDLLVGRLVADGRLDRAPEPPRTIARHRGFQAIGERARIAE